MTSRNGAPFCAAAYRAASKAKMQFGSPAGTRG
jgi:hypothetical protein